jgi:hypothetical protein
MKIVSAANFAKKYLYFTYVIQFLMRICLFNVEFILISPIAVLLFIIPLNIANIF